MAIRFALIGAGRIGRFHAQTLSMMPQAELVSVSDAQENVAREVASQVGAKVATADDAINDKSVDAVFIASSTDTHADLIDQAATAGKAVFCEKPIDLSADRVRDCLQVVKECAIPLVIGFNRRFDPNFSELKRRLDDGAIGEIELINISSRDPAPPPMEYVKVSGGIFRDMMIHDLDLACWYLGEMPVEIFASGSCLIDSRIGDAGDFDTAIIGMRSSSGQLCQISNSRRAVYGYDQRIEIHGSAGRLIAGNPSVSTIEQAGELGVLTDRLMHFFMDRYSDSYRLELEAFIRKLEGAEDECPTGEDGLRALLLADAAMESIVSGSVIKL